MIRKFKPRGKQWFGPIGQEYLMIYDTNKKRGGWIDRSTNTIEYTDFWPLVDIENAVCSGAWVEIKEKKQVSSFTNITKKKIYASYLANNIEAMYESPSSIAYVAKELENLTKSGQEYENTIRRLAKESVVLIFPTLMEEIEKEEITRVRVLDDDDNYLFSIDREDMNW